MGASCPKCHENNIRGNSFCIKIGSTSYDGNNLKINGKIYECSQCGQIFIKFKYTKITDSQKVKKEGIIRKDQHQTIILIDNIQFDWDTFDLSLII